MARTIRPGHRYMPSERGYGTVGSRDPSGSREPTYTVPGSGHRLTPVPRPAADAW